MNGQDMVGRLCGDTVEGTRERDGEETRFEFHSNESVKLFRSFVRSFPPFQRPLKKPRSVSHGFVPIGSLFPIFCQTVLRSQKNGKELEKKRGMGMVESGEIAWERDRKRAFKLSL